MTCLRWSKCTKSSNIYGTVLLTNIKINGTMSSIFFGRNFHHPLLPHPPLQPQIRGSCNCDGWKLDDKNYGRKDQKQILKNVGRRHNIANSRVLRLRWGKLRDKNRSRKNRTDVSSFFSSNFCHPIPSPLPPLQSQNPWIHNIVSSSSSNSFENLPIAITGSSNSRYCVFVKQFWEF